MGSGAKSYMRKGFPIYEEMRKFFTIHMRRPLVIYDFAPDPSEFPYIWGKFHFSLLPSTANFFPDLFFSFLLFQNFFFSHIFPLFYCDISLSLSFLRVLTPPLPCVIDPPCLFLLFRDRPIQIISPIQLVIIPLPFVSLFSQYWILLDNFSGSACTPDGTQ